MPIYSAGRVQVATRLPHAQTHRPQRGRPSSPLTPRG